MTSVKKFSYLFVALTLLMVGVFKMATPFLAVLFSFLFLELLKFKERKWIAVTLFLTLTTVAFLLFIFFVNQSRSKLPEIAERAIPVFAEYAEGKGVQLPFEDVSTAKTLVVHEVQARMGYVAKYAKILTTEFAFLIIGIVVAISMFLNSKLDPSEGSYPIENNLYSSFVREISVRFQLLFSSFSDVMGAQMKISAINTFFTAVFLVVVGLPYALIVIVLTFCFGLLPVVGNLISNTVIVGVALASEPKLALPALVFLIVLHKLEYFLNSKIIGDQIKTPVWLTLLALVVGERAMGIPGMILAPVVIHYIKQECTLIEVVNSPT